MNYITKASLSLYKLIKSLINRLGITIPEPLKKLNKRYLKSLRKDSVVIDGSTLYLDEADSLLLSVNNIYEEFETKLVKELIKEGDVVLDIGANIGYYTVQFAKKVGPTGSVIAFEPDPINFAILKKNIEVNGFTNVELHNIAVSDTKGILKLFINESNRGDNRMYDSQDSRNAIEVPTEQIDEVMKSKPTVNFIKMDIQGAEIKAIRGMKHVFDNSPNLTMISEFWPVGIHRCGGDAKEFLDSLVEHGFQISEIDENRHEVKDISDVSVLLTENTVENELYSNLLCTK